ncbi:hypothetical protein [Acinetobacter puyangensis]|uniref:hypothetical protein n=1 Tax=Acinetobacter puyangensis TaxID=1096779 RepID=UPI003A4E64D8
MPERLELTKNVQFYKPISKITKNLINDLLKKGCENKEQGKRYVINKIREIVEIDNISATFSIRVYPTTRPVFFMDDDLEDRIYAFLILIELNGYLLVLSKSCANIQAKLNENFELVQNTELSKLITQDAEFQKLALKNMTVSGKAIRNRSYEAENLKGVFSIYAAGRSIPYHIKVREHGTIKSLSSTGRLVESSNRQSLNEIIIWANNQINLLNNSSINAFLDYFAKKVQLQEVLNNNNPSAILIEVAQILEKLDSGELDLQYYFNKDRFIKLSSRVKNKLFCELEKVYEINSKFEVVTYNKTTISKTKNKLSINTNILRKFKIIENNKPEGLIAYINRKGYFSITFDNHKYMYFMNNCFEDTSGISEIDSILELLEPQVAISTVTSEKGKFEESHSIFDKHSMFGVVEEIFCNDDYILCDDLGDEWADHITININESCINFIHSKHGDTTTSASKLHDVVGQAIKNIGNMNSSKEALEAKFINYKSSNYSNTKISRIRKQAGNFNNDISLLLKDHKLHRKCILSCSFISKQQITTEFLKIKAGKQVKGHITQLLWIISSFSHAAKEANVIPIIYCKP